MLEPTSLTSAFTGFATLAIDLQSSTRRYRARFCNEPQSALIDRLSLNA
jgi:hypothetical protein